MEKTRGEELDRNNIAKLNLAHRRFVTTALTMASACVAVSIASLTVFVSVYNFLEETHYILRMFWSLVSFLILFYVAMVLAKMAKNNLDMARKIELKLNVEKTLEEFGIVDLTKRKSKVNVTKQ